MKSMTPAQALQVLTNATAQIQATRADHEIITTALMTIGHAIEEKKPKKVQGKTEDGP